MALRIIKVDRATETHWEYAKRNEFWDLKQAFELREGDTVIFWRGGSPGKILGQATVRGEMEPLGPREPHAWSREDTRRGQYKHRVGLIEFRELPQIEVTYGEFGFTGQSPVFRVPDHKIAEFVRRVGVRLTWSDILYGQLLDAVEDTEFEEPTRYDEDHRVRIPASVVIRRGAAKFRRKLLMAYEGRCAVTGTSIPGLLEAAHISSYKGDHTDKVQNGLLLRSDVHTLFDLHLLTVLPDLTIRVAPDAMADPYDAYDGGRIAVPGRRSHRPDAGVLREHNRTCDWLQPSSEAEGALF